MNQFQIWQISGLCLSSTPKAIEVLKDETEILRAILINASVGEKNIIQLIRSVHSFRIGAPMYLIKDKEIPIGFDLNALGIQATVTKEEVGKICLALKAEDSSSPSGPPLVSSSPSVILFLDDASLFPVNAGNFVSGSKALFDLFLKLRSGHYLRAVQAGKTFEKTQLESHELLKPESKSLIYLKKEAWQAYLGFCDQTARQLLDSPNLSPQVKVSQTLHYGEEALSYLKEAGIGEEQMIYVTHFIQYLNLMMNEIQKSGSVELTDFLSNLFACEHGVTTAALSALMGRALGISDQEIKAKLGIASFFHDIALAPLGVEFEEEDESKLNSEQKKLFRSHPVAGAFILRGTRGIVPEVGQIILHHHERQNGQGFPDGLRGEIHPYAEILGISDEFHWAGRKTKPNEDFLVHFYSGIQSRFSKSLLSAFSRVFLRS